MTAESQLAIALLSVAFLSGCSDTTPANQAVEAEVPDSGGGQGLSIDGGIEAVWGTCGRGAGGAVDRTRSEESGEWFYICVYWVFYLGLDF